MTETPSAAYTLLDLSVHANIKYSKTQTFQLLLQLNNALNNSYQSHLSRLQYFEYYRSSPNGRTGVYNTGRNFCMKLIVPF